MNIQPFGSTATPKVDERPAGAAEPPASAATAGARPVSKPVNPAAKPPPSRDEVDAAVKKLNDSLSASPQSLEFSIDHDSKEIVVKLIDQNTKEVLRQIPSVEALEIAKSIDQSLDKKQGLLIHQTA